MVATAKTGVYTRTKQNGTTSFIITYTINGKSFKKTLGTNLEGWTLIKADRERSKFIHTNIIPASKKAHISLDTAFNEYMLSIAHKSDARNTRGRYENHIKPMLGHIQLDKITVSDIHRLKIELSVKVSKKTDKQLAPKTQNDMIDLVNTTFIYHNKIYRQSKLESPANVELVERLKVDNSRLRFLSVDEFRQLTWFIESRNSFTHNRNANPRITEELLLYVKLLVTTGVRTFSALTIRPKDINFSAGTITVKNHKSNRIYTTYIHESIREKLVAICGQLSPEQYIFGRGVVPLHGTTLNRRLKIILDKLFNEHTTDRRELVVTHSLRHTFGSWLVQQGTSLYIVSKLMDHATISQTQVYAKLLPNSGADEVSKLDI